MERQADVFMLGDELLVAPVLSANALRHVELPRGLWTDLRTNVEYRGNQAIEVDASPGPCALVCSKRIAAPVRSVPIEGRGEDGVALFSIARW